MKIYRVVTVAGETIHAGRPDSEIFYRLSGSFPDFELTDESVSVAKILPPLVPPAIYIVGYNYSSNPVKAREEAGPYPVIVMKAASTVIADGESIELPRHLISDEVDYEGELAVIIGKAAKNIAYEDADEYIMGYTVANDLTARDWQRQGAGGQWVRGKNFDTFCPLGPAIVTRDAVDLAKGLRLQTRVNGVLRQDDTTDSMIFSISEVIAFLSGNNTLLPGTVILTGTPTGTGKHQNPPEYLKSGDVVCVEIEGLGRLQNPVLAS
jgi:2-keto-4-pentenoate hydratase/2-oxohepta-3-ene-1,7-dioic acid hydratase in catechol pathway